MFTNSVCNIFKSKRQFLLQFVNSASISNRYNSQQNVGNTKREKWDLLSAVSLERKPIVSRELNQLEKDMANILNNVEFERSYKADHEIQLVAEKKKLEQFKKGDNLDLDSLPETSAQDFEDANQVELNAFPFASRKTDADKNNDLKTIQRHLDRNLLLLVKENIGKNKTWVLPQGVRQEGETLRQTAERVLNECCGTELKAEFFGNAPVGFYKYRYPTNVDHNKETPIGAKIFFFKAQWKEGNIKLNSKLVDYQWATRKELEILHKSYKKSVSMFLVNEDH